MDRFDCIVIGAGVVGLAVARRLALAGLDTLVLEREATPGTQTSSRNSEVIHAGIYYPPGSLKARLCVQGREQLYRYCELRGVPHRRCGKLVVAAADAERATLHDYLDAGARNGVTDLEWRTAAQVSQLEPAIRCAAALWSPSTGIVESHALMRSLLDELDAACRAEVTGAQLANNSHRVSVTQGDATTEIAALLLVNAAGLDAQGVARRTAGLGPTTIPPRRLAKGHYFTLQGRRLRTARILRGCPQTTASARMWPRTQQGESRRCHAMRW